jgi:hypothetical protein
MKTIEMILNAWGVISAAVAFTLLCKLAADSFNSWSAKRKRAFESRVQAEIPLSCIVDRLFDRINNLEERAALLEKASVKKR